MPKMYDLKFDYPITRPYPFKWFSKVAISGLIVLTVVFSFVNLTSNGFNLKPLYTTDLNATIAKANARWFNKRPFNWQGDMDVQCQPHPLAVGSSFFTSNQGFQYKVKAIKLPTNNTNSPDLRSTIGYKNTQIQDCFMSELLIVLLKSDPAQLPTWWMSFVNSVATVTLQCTVISDSGPAEVTLEAEYQGQAQHEYNYILNSNYKTHASVWWGTRLSNIYFTGLLSAVSQTSEIDIVPAKGYVNRARLRFTPYKPNSDIRSEDFFHLDWSFNFDNSQIRQWQMEEVKNVVKYNSDFWGSPTLTEGLHYAKIMYSLFALDLGSCDSPNLLLDEDGINYAISDPKNTNRMPGGLLNDTETLYRDLDAIKFNNIPWPEPGDDRAPVKLNETWNTFNPLMGPLSCKNATIVAQYLCSVPEQKSTGNMILAIVLANLVFLQAAWKVLQAIAGRMVAKNPQAMFCEGCLRAHSTESEDEEKDTGEMQDRQSDEHVSNPGVSPRYSRIQNGDDRAPGSNSRIPLQRVDGSE